MVAVAAAAGLMSAIPPLVTRFLFDSVIPSASSGQVLTVSLSLTGAAVVFLLLQLCRNFAKLRIETRWDLQVQTGLMDRLLNLPVQFFRDYSAGDLAMRVTALGNARVALSGVLALFLLSGFAGIFNAAVMFLYDFRLALTGLAIIVLALIVCLAFTYVAIHHGRIIALLEGQLGSRVLQLLTGIPKLRAAGAEVHAFAAWAGRFSEIRRTKYRLLRHTAWFQTISRSCALFGQMVVFAVTGLLLWRAAAFGGGGEATPISVGTFLAFTTAFFGVVGIVLSVAAFSPQLAAVAPILERLKPILDTPPEVNAHRRDPRNLSGSIEVSHLSYRYRPNCPLVLKDVSFSIRPGEFVAVVGPSGSGKSTLLRLLLGFDQPETGAVHYDGQDLSGLDIGAVRRQIGTVMQNGELLPASILENIRGNRRLSLEECWEALTLAGLKDEVNQLPMGIHTIVGVGARVFSGGQLQRMQIARAIAARPRLVFLDEATTALDNRTQAQVSRSLEQLQSSRLVIAHRLSTVYNADRIIVLHDGCKVQEGTFQELLQVPGVFADLASRQMLKASP
jgi:ATP-binding cassette subfamily C protein